MDTYQLRHETRGMNNREYRQWYMANVHPKFYSPALHVCFNIGTLLALVVFHFTAVKAMTPASWAMMLAMLIIGNMAVWWIHQYPLHRRWKWWSFPYDAHTVQHHRYFTSDHILLEEKDEIYDVMFPWFVVAGFAIVAQPIFYFLVLFLSGSEDLAHVFAGSAAAYFILYEFVHTSNHLRDDHIILKIPGLKFMKEHHRLHHNPKLMGKYNMGIVFPFADYLFGTKYKGSEVPEDRIEDHFEDLESYS